VLPRRERARARAPRRGGGTVAAAGYRPPVPERAPGRLGAIVRTMSESTHIPARCEWAADSDALMLRYHDEEWGVPQHDERALFELLTLEGAQAGLSWRTVLHRREDYRAAFAGWDIERIANFGELDIERLLAEPASGAGTPGRGIIRNRAKVEATIGNARAALAVMHQWDTLDRFLWQFVGQSPKSNGWRRLEEVPSETLESR